VVGHTETWLVSDHPVCGAKVGFAEIFLMPQPPLLTRRGMSWPEQQTNLFTRWDPVQFASSDFGFEMQDSSNFEIV
jgi:hypothetical protein